jgi:hypothetical protein
MKRVAINQPFRREFWQVLSISHAPLEAQSYHHTKLQGASSAFSDFHSHLHLLFREHIYIMFNRVRI